MHAFMGERAVIGGCTARYGTNRGPPSAFSYPSRRSMAASAIRAWTARLMLGVPRIIPGEEDSELPHLLFPARAPEGLGQPGHGRIERDAAPAPAGYARPVADPDQHRGMDVAIGACHRPALTRQP